MCTLIFFELFAKELIAIGFWEMLTAIGTFGVAIIALLPIIESKRLSNALYQDALRIAISINGVLTITNIYDKTIVINSISQRLLRGSEIGVNTPKYVLGKRTNEPKSDFIKNNLGAIRKNIAKTDPFNDEFKKRLAPNTSFDYANTLTHLPAGMETEYIWFVQTKITYSGTTGHKPKTIERLDRFSFTIEPRSRWIEILDSTA